MLTIENLHKIVGRKIPIYAINWTARIKDVYYTTDNTYVFEIETNALNYVKVNTIRIILDRKPPIGIYPGEKAWEMSYQIQTGSNQYDVELVSTKVVRDMNLFGIALGGFVDRIMNSKY